MNELLEKPNWKGYERFDPYELASRSTQEFPSLTGLTEEDVEREVTRVQNEKYSGESKLDCKSRIELYRSTLPQKRKIWYKLN